ncbi:polycystin 2 [Pseudoscourfieldia marina]
MLGTLKSIWKWYSQNEYAKEFTLYLVFVVLFSIVSFASKPGVTQYDTNMLTLDNFASSGNENYDDFDEISDVSGMWGYLEGHMAGLLFPNENYDGSLLDAIARLYILGNSRVMGAMRLRQVRSVDVNCPTPSWLQDVYGTSVKCQSPFTGGNKDTKPIHENTSKLENFTRPFLFQSAGALNTTNVYTFEGLFGKYSQDGYAVDLLPNVAAFQLAEMVEECIPVMEMSTNKCMEEQGVTWERFPPPPPPAAPQMSPPPPLFVTDGPGIAFKGSKEADDKLRREMFFNFELSDQPGESDKQEVIIMKNTGRLQLDWQLDPLSLQLNGSVAEWMDTIKTTPVSGKVNADQTVGITIAVGLGPTFVDLPAGTTRNMGSLRLTFGDKNSEAKGYVNVNVTYASPASAAAPAGAAPAGPARRLLATAASTSRQAARRGLSGSPHSPSRMRRTLIERDLSTCSTNWMYKKDGFVQNRTKVPSALDTKKCAKVENHAIDQNVCNSVYRDLGYTNCYCQLPYVSYQTLLELMELKKCGNCKCKKDPDASCSNSCTAQNIYSKQIEKLKSNGWVDGKTRAVVLDTNLLDANFNLFTTMRNIWEMPTIGGVFPYQKSRTFKLYRYVTGADMIIAILEIIFFAMIVWYTVEELIEIRKSGWEYWGDGWNYLDWANLIILYAVYDLQIPPLYATHGLNSRDGSRVLVRPAPVRHHGIHRAVRIRRAFYVSFGADVYEYRTLSAAHSTLALILLGDFDYAAIYDSNKVMAPRSSTCYGGDVLHPPQHVPGDYLRRLRGCQGQSERGGLELLLQPQGSPLDKISNLVTRKRAIKDLTEDILASDRNVDGLIDEDELKEVLKDNPKAYEILNSRGAKDLLAKYDVNQDGVLDKAEMSAILRELAEKEAEIETEMKIAETDEAEAEAHIASHGVGGAVRGGGGGMVAAHVDLKPVEDRIDKVEGQVKELSSFTKSVWLLNLRVYTDLKVRL